MQLVLFERLGFLPLRPLVDFFGPAVLVVELREYSG